MIYKMLPKLNPEDTQIFARIDDDGKCRVTCIEINSDYLKWLAEGNTPEPADGEQA